MSAVARAADGLLNVWIGMRHATLFVLCSHLLRHRVASSTVVAQDTNEVQVPTTITRHNASERKYASKTADIMADFTVVHSPSRLITELAIRSRSESHLSQARLCEDAEADWRVYRGTTTRTDYCCQAYHCLFLLVLVPDMI